MPHEISLMVSTEGLAALTDMALAPKNQSKLDDLLAQNANTMLSSDESKELDRLLKTIDALNVVKARAAATLHEMGR